jgi:hypothetical protein
MLQMRDDELVPIGSDEVTEVAAQIRRVRTVRSPHDIAVVLPGLPHDPAGLEAAGSMTCPKSSQQVHRSS